MTSSTDAFRAARDLLLRYRDDYDAARRSFSWPALDEFNWALDWFDVIAAEHPDRPALRILSDDGSDVSLSYGSLAALVSTFLILSVLGGATDNGLGLIASPALHATLSFPNGQDVILGINVDFYIDDLNPNQRAIGENIDAGPRYSLFVSAKIPAEGGGLAYTSSKHAVVGMTRELACEYGPVGIRSNAICPGSIATNLRETSREILGSGAPDMNKGVGTAAPERLRAIVPLGIRGTPDDVANVAVFLASGESDYVNGHTLVVDGGWVAH